jgi:hypothetical protein
MISIQETILQLLGKYIVAANNASFLWRKLAESSTVRYLSINEATENLLDTLKELLLKDELNENEQTIAYCLIVALLLNNRAHSKTILTIENIKKLFWSSPLINFACQDSSTKTTKKVNQGPIILSTNTSSNSLTNTNLFSEGS